MADRHIFTLSNGEICICSPTTEADPARPGWRFERSRLRVWCDDEPANLTPSDEGFTLTLPTLRAMATVIVPPLKTPSSWNFGWICACASLVDQQVYGDCGEAAWELPYAFVNVSDGSCMPWNGSTTQKVRVCGPTSADRSVSVSMTEKLGDSVRWQLPQPPDGSAAAPSDGGGQAQLTAVRRHYDYSLWLAASNDSLTEIHVLKTFKWDADLHISVDCKKPLQHRASFVAGRDRVANPVLLDNVEIPPQALLPPTYNQVKKLIWYPAGKSTVSTVVIPPEWEVF